MDNETEQPSQSISIQTPARPEDRRAAELDELRKRNVAKTMQGQLDGKSQPITTKESWYQQQKEQSQQSRQQEMDATANLHSYRNRNANVSATDDVKEELKKREMEAAAMLHNYRGTPEAILSHQVKKSPPNSGSKTNLMQVPVEGYDTAPSTTVERANFGDLRSKFGGSVPEPANGVGAAPAGTDAVPTLESKDDGGVDSFLQSLDDEFLPSPDAQLNVAILSKPSESSNESNENSTESTGWVVLTEKQQACMESADDFTKIEAIVEVNAEAEADPVPEAIEEPVSVPLFVQPPQQQPEWIITPVSASFNLLTDEDDAPPLGSYSAGVGSQLLNELIGRMKTIAVDALESYIQNGDVRQLDLPFHVSVVRDGKMLFGDMFRARLSHYMFVANSLFNI